MVKPMLCDLTAAKRASGIRKRIREQLITGTTSGLAEGCIQANVVMLPASIADEFLRFCQLNPKPCPVLSYSEPGQPSLDRLGVGIDIRTDVPEYCVMTHGVVTQTCFDVTSYWQHDTVAIAIGCSYSFENALTNAGFTARNVELGLNVSMYDTNIPTIKTDHFCGNMVVSMRPYKQSAIKAVTDITSRFAKTHGGPIHIGDPAAIGIKDIRCPDYGDVVPIEADEVPVFWACGVTSQRILIEAQLPQVITHSPGKMLVTDLLYDDLPD